MPLVKPMAPGSILHHISFHLFYFAIFTFNLYHKNTKNIYLIIIISIRSHSCKWLWRDWQPLYCIGCEVLICLCRYEVTHAWSPTGLIPWFSKTEGNTYAALRHHPFLFKGKPTQCSRGSKKDFWRRCQGDLRQVKTYQVPITTLILRITLFSMCLSFSSPPFHPCHFIRPLFPNLLSLFRLPFCLFVCWITYRHCAR